MTTAVSILRTCVCLSLSLSVRFPRLQPMNGLLDYSKARDKPSIDTQHAQVTVMSAKSRHYSGWNVHLDKAPVASIYVNYYYTSQNFSKMWPKQHVSILYKSVLTLGTFSLAAWFPTNEYSYVMMSLLLLLLVPIVTGQQPFIAMLINTDTCSNSSIEQYKNNADFIITLRSYVKYKAEIFTLGPALAGYTPEHYSIYLLIKISSRLLSSTIFHEALCQALHL